MMPAPRTIATAAATTVAVTLVARFGVVIPTSVAIVDRAVSGSTVHCRVVHRGRVCGPARAGGVGALETWLVVFWQAGAMPARRRPGDGRSGEDDPAGRRAAREAATRQLSALLKRLQVASGVTWDELAETAHVSRSTVANYVGESVRRRDLKTVKSLLDGMNGVRLS